jgi:hypothetical protein
VRGQHDRSVDRPDQVADRGRIGGEPAQRVGRGDHRVTSARQRIDDAVPARGLGEGAVNENDRGLHDEVLSVG